MYIHSGTTLLRLQPQLIVPNEGALLNACYVCFAERGEAHHLAPLIECRGCKLTRYCGDTCQEKDAPIHQKECIAIQRLFKLSNAKIEDPQLPMRRLCRLYWERKRRGAKWWAPIESLQWHEVDDKDEDFTTDQVVEFAQTLIGLADGIRPDMAELRRMHLKAVTNSFDGMDADMGTRLGYVLDSTAALINHSCTPNVNVIYPHGLGVEKPLHVVAYQGIKSGDELTYAYVSPATP